MTKFQSSNASRQYVRYVEPGSWGDTRVEPIDQHSCVSVEWISGPLTCLSAENQRRGALLLAKPLAKRLGRPLRKLSLLDGIAP